MIVLSFFAFFGSLSFFMVCLLLCEGSLCSPCVHLDSLLFLKREDKKRLIRP